MLAALIPALAPIVQSLVERIPDPAARDKAAAEASSRLLELMAAQDSQQVEVNKTEAQHSSLFVAGWRPAAGWCCVLGLGYNFLVQPLLAAAVATWAPHVVLPAIDLEPLMVLLGGMLGLGGLRSWEKARGVARAALPGRKPQ